MRRWRVGIDKHEYTAASSAPGGQKVDPATAGDVTGSVVFDGTAPKNEPIRMNADPIVPEAGQAVTQTQETYHGWRRRQVARQRIRVREGRSRQLRHTMPPTGSVTIDQNGLPLSSARVRHAHRTDRSKSSTSDPTLHNIHATPKANSEFNTGQPIQGMKTEPHVQCARK